MRLSSVIGAFCTVVLVSAQDLTTETPAQLAARIPSCVVCSPFCFSISILSSSISFFNRTKSDSRQLPCDKAAIAQVGCSETDYSCHCKNSAQLQWIITPCLQNTSTCNASELTSMYLFQSSHLPPLLQLPQMAEMGAMSTVLIWESAFGTLVNQICLNLNVTGTSTSTSGPSSTSPVTVGTNAAIPLQVGSTVVALSGMMFAFLF